MNVHNVDGSFIVVWCDCECHFVPLLPGCVEVRSFVSWSAIVWMLSSADVLWSKAACGSCGIKWRWSWAWRQFRPQRSVCCCSYFFILFLSKLKLLLASKKGTEVPARDKEVFFLKAVCCMPIQQTAFLKYFHVPCGKLGSPYLVRQSSHKSSATHS